MMDDVQSVRSSYSHRSAPAYRNPRHAPPTYQGGAAASVIDYRPAGKSRSARKILDGATENETAKMLSEESAGEGPIPDNLTVITGMTSECSIDDLDVAMADFDDDDDGNQCCSICFRRLPLAFVFFMNVVFLFSPLVMVCIPYIPYLDWYLHPCTLQCETVYLEFASKMLALLILTIYICNRTVKSECQAVLPRLNFLRSCLILVLALIVAAFWLFYVFRVIPIRDSNVITVISHAASLVDSILLFQFVATLIDYYNNGPEKAVNFSIKVVRNPDGAYKYYTVSQMTIQDCALFVLQRYSSDFAAYNPLYEAASRNTPFISGASNSERANSRGDGGGKHSFFKFYDVDGLGGGNPDQPDPLTGQMPSQNGSGNVGLPPNGDHKPPSSRRAFKNRARSLRDFAIDRYHAQNEFKCRVEKRACRVLVAAEDIWSCLDRVTGPNGCPELGPHKALDVEHTAMPIFSAITKPLNKYLRITRQNSRYQRDDILNHLTDCVALDVGPKSFLEKYFKQEVPLFVEKETDQTNNLEQRWTLIVGGVADVLNSKPCCGRQKSTRLTAASKIEHDALFQLRSRAHPSPNATLISTAAISLTVKIKRLPKYNICEESLSLDKLRFQLKSS